MKDGPESRPGLPRTHAKAWRTLSAPLNAGLAMHGWRRIESSCFHLYPELYGQPPGTSYYLPFDWYIRADGTYAELAMHVWQVTGAPYVKAGTVILGTLLTFLARPKASDSPESQAVTQQSLRLGHDGLDDLRAFLSVHVERLRDMQTGWRITIPASDEEALRWLHAARAQD